MKNHPIKNIARDKLEIWEQANVRKTNIEEDLDELADNIKRNGIEHPLLVKETNGKYKVFAGQRRFLASELINLDYLPCKVFQNITLEKAISLSLSENVFSKKMTAFDKADAVKILLSQHKNKTKVCKILGIKPSTLQQYLYYHGLPSDVKNYVDDGLINMQFASNVMRKFSRNNSMDILYHLSRLKKQSIPRKLLLAAIKTASKEDSLDDIKQSIKNLDSSSVSIKLSLDSNELKDLQKIANKYKLNVDETSSKLLRAQIKKEIRL